MNVLKTALLVFLGLFITHVLPAQIIQDPAKWTFEAKKKTGNQYDLIFHLKLKENWHIYSFKAGGDGSLLSPTFDFDKNSNIKLVGKTKEKGKLISGKMEGIDGIVHEYKNNVDYIQTVSITGNTTITGTHLYQVCDDKMCLPPKTKPFSFTISDAGSKDAVKAIADTSDPVLIYAPPAIKDTTLDGSSATAAKDTATLKAAVAPVNKKHNNNNTKGKQMSLLELFLLSFGGGLLAVVTPCVFSMIPITVSFFTKRSKSRKEGIRNALYYSLSIIIIFTVLGLLVSGLFGRDALYKISTNWVVNLVFFLLFIIFGISFLGAFEITLPSSWTNKTDSKAGLGSFSGIFFMALTLVIVSFSCTGPILTLLFALAASGGFIGPIVGMFAFSLGLSLPFAVCAIFPAAINKLGKSGGWLNQIKVTLGFIELAFALKFLSNVDLLLHWRLLDREIFIAIWIVIAVLLGLYLLGKLKLSHDDAPAKNVYGQEYVSIFKLFLAIASFTFALYLLPGMWGAPLNGLGQFLPNMGTQEFVLGSGDRAAATANKIDEDIQPKKFVDEMNTYEPNVVSQHQIVTYYDYEEGLKAARKLKKPIMLDFTGITCANCRKMETSVWSDPEVWKRIKNDFILISMYDDARNVDLPKEDQYFSKTENTKITTLGDKCLDIQIVKYNSNAQPFYFFIDENENKLANEGYGYDPDVQKFIAHLDAVKAKYQKEHS